MIRAVIADDESAARENLSNLLKKYCSSIDIVGQADSAATAFDQINQHQPELIFLDIQMPDATSIELLEKIDHKEFEIIFVTAYDKYAIKAIKFEPLDYLLKPIDILELQAAVKKAEKKITERKKEKQDTEPVSGKKKISLSTSDGMIFLPVNEIIRCQASDSYTTFFTINNEKVIVSRSLKEFEDQLAPYNFFRIHQSHLINLEHIRKYIKGNGGQVVMNDDSTITIARRKKDEFLKALETFNG